MARTKQTARKSTGGKAPRKLLAIMESGSPGDKQFSQKHDTRETIQGMGALSLKTKVKAKL